MKRVFAIVLAFLIPLQSALGAVVPITSAGGHACERRLTPPGHQGAYRAATVDDSGCSCKSAACAGAHGTMSSHACPHLGAAFVAIAPLQVQPHAFSSVLPESKHVSFVSIVLDVPSPPPTRLA
jgi:hypothetical protein